MYIYVCVCVCGCGCVCVFKMGSIFYHYMQVIEQFTYSVYVTYTVMLVGFFITLLFNQYTADISRL